MTADKTFVNRFSSAWRIRGSYNGQPLHKPGSIFRYMHQEYVELFFERGLLKLSTHESNRTIEDSIRRDGNEGTGDVVVVSRDKQRQLLMQASAFDHRMLCFSEHDDIPAMKQHFKVDGCFEVTNTTGFGFELAQAMEGFVSGLEGIVTYVPQYRIAMLLEHHPHLPDLTEGDTPNEKVFQYIDAFSRTDGPNDLMFSKPPRFRDEREYRFTWRCGPNTPMVIHCPGALKYCKRI